MPQGKGKASSPRRRSSDGHPYDVRLPLPLPRKVSSTMAHESNAPSASYLDASIPFNLPPRRSMKMLKDGSDFVWPDAAHSLFVRGLQAWKFMNIGSKRTRAPRGEGKTDFLVRYLQTHGVERTKKQVASHLQVLRTEWRNMDNVVLLSLVDEAVSHTRSLSEPSLPPPAPSTHSSPSSPLSVFNISPDPGDDRSISTPALPSPIPTAPPPTSSSLFHPAHNVYSGRPHSFPVMMPIETFHAQSSTDVGSWQLDNTVWNTPIDRFPLQQAEPSLRPQLQHAVTSYDPPAPFQGYEKPPKPITSSMQESLSLNSDYYDPSSLFGSGGQPSIVDPFPQGPHFQSSQSPEINSPSASCVPASPYESYNHPSSYPFPQQSTLRDDYGNASMSYGTEPYQPQFGPGDQLQQATPSHTVEITGSASYDAVEPDFLPGVQPHAQPQWIRPPATFSRASDAPE